MERRITMLQEILCNQRDLTLLGNIGALALSALAYRRLHRHEVPGVHPPSQLDPIAFAWAHCNPDAPFPKALKGAPSALAISLASAPHARSSVGVNKAA